MPLPARALAPIASGFTPAAITGLVHWWDASDASTLTTASGTVSEWRSKAGARTAATQTVANNQPTTTTVNGRQALLFDGANDGFSFAGTSRTDETWIIAAAQLGNAPTTQALVNDAGNGHGITFVAGSVKLIEASFAGGFTEGTHRLRVQYAASSATLVGPAVVSVVRSAAAGGFVFVDGTQRSSSVNGASSFTSSQATTMQRIGHYGSTLFQLNGWIGDVLLYNRALSAAERLRVERWLGRRWGVAIP